MTGVRSGWNPRSNPLLHLITGWITGRITGWAARCRGLWYSRAARREGRREGLRLRSRLSVSHGSTLAVVQFESERFLVATSAKGQIALLAIAPGDASPRPSKKSGAPSKTAVRP